MWLEPLTYILLLRGFSMSLIRHYLTLLNILLAYQVKSLPWRGSMHYVPTTGQVNDL